MSVQHSHAAPDGSCCVLRFCILLVCLNLQAGDCLCDLCFANGDCLRDSEVVLRMEVGVGCEDMGKHGMTQDGAVQSDVWLRWWPQREHNDVLLVVCCLRWGLHKSQKAQWGNWGAFPKLTK